MAKGLYMQCKICARDCPSIVHFARHITHVHKMSTRTYYDSHLKNSTDGHCIVCNGPTIFRNLGEGYAKTCGHSCGAKRSRKLLKADTARHQQFIDRIAQSQTLVWQNRSVEERQAIIDKITAHENYWKRNCWGRWSATPADLECIGRKDCKHFGITFQVGNAFADSQVVINENIAFALGMAHG